MNSSQESHSTSSYPNKFLYLDQEAVIAAGVLNARRVISIIEEAQTLFAQRQVREPHKTVLRNADTVESEQHGRFNALAASIGAPVQQVGIKWIASFPANRRRGLPRASGLIILNCAQTGTPLAVMEASLISAMRTGAMTALGVRCLAPKRTRKIGIIGAGVLSRSQILCLWTELPELQEITIFGRRVAAAEEVADDCRSQWGAPVRVATSPEQVFDEADVAITATPAQEPLMLARCIKPGALTIQIAGHECEFAVIRQCSKIVTDDWETVKHRGIMTLAIMHQRGVFRDEQIHGNLAEIIIGKKPGREGGERIHYGHMGMAINDVALASAIYKTAIEQKLGISLPLWEKPLWV
jgi:ornithine cyclodeaminase/alanine dehydrogenase-like protein (mu-crystallin family)